MSIKKVILFFFSFALLTLLLEACSSQKRSEKEQYEDIRSSFKYKTYKAISKSSVPLLVANYNKTTQTDYQINESYFRLLLGYYWSISGHPAFAFAEADVLMENGSTGNLSYLASMINSCTMYEQGWTTLAKEESDKGMSLAAKSADKELLVTETIIFHLLLY